MTESGNAPRRPYADPGGGRVLCVRPHRGEQARDLVPDDRLCAAHRRSCRRHSSRSVSAAPRCPGAFLVVQILSLIVYALMSYRFSTQAVLSISGAHEVSKQEEWEFVRRVENLCIGAGLPMPRTWVLEDSAPNAFATGISPDKSHVVVTRGFLLDKLEPAELEGVLAHELSHINYDIRVMTIVTVLVGVVALISDSALRLRSTAQGRAGAMATRGTARAS